MLKDGRTEVVEPRPSLIQSELVKIRDFKGFFIRVYEKLSLLLFVGVSRPNQPSIRQMRQLCLLSISYRSDGVDGGGL